MSDDILPLALSIGIKYETFWHLNPKKLMPFKKAEEIKYKNRMQEEEMKAFMYGTYTAHAVSLIGKGKFPEKPLHFFDFSQTEIEHKNPEDLTEDEKIVLRKKLIAGLQIMQCNFEREQRKKQEDNDNADTSQEEQ